MSIIYIETKIYYSVIYHFVNVNTYVQKIVQIIIIKYIFMLA